ncbi:MAG: hypothetical protein COB69_02085 [Phycisphaera sp.]|nr:MAG: hypothetical protein COB69_02085 [Phycisphaera sp.]
MTPATFPSQTNHASYNSRCTRAFTLIELVIVIVIISITAAIAIPRLSGASTRYRVDAAVQQVLSDIKVTSAEANRISRTRSIRFEAASESYMLVGQPSLNNPATDQIVNLSLEPYNVNMLRVSFGGDSRLDISAYGLMLEAGELTLAAGRQGRRIVFTQGSSSIQIVNLNLTRPTDDEDIDIDSTGDTRDVDTFGDTGSFSAGMN